jgi:hypothetical protein
MIDPLFPLMLSIVVAIVVLATLIYLETRRKQKYLVFRIIAQFFLVSSVFLLALRPSVEKQAEHKSLVLLTEGYQQNKIDSLRLKPVSVSSFNELPKVSGITAIAGNGLPSWALELLPAKNYSFIPSPVPKGITAIEIDEHIYAHRWNEIRGTYNGGSALLKLRGPGGLEDSVEVSNGSFSLSFFAKAPGRFNYQLITGNEEEDLPLVIEPERTFNIIFVSDYPTFEMRYLKNFLASKGHRLSIRNQVSRGLYKFEFANRPAENFQSLTTQLLKATDLVIIDERSWHTLGAVEQKNLQSAVNDGLGVIVMPEAKPEKNRSSLVQFTATEEKDTARVALGRAGSFRLPALALEAKQSEPLLTSTEHRVLSGFRHSGAGKVGFQFLLETYQLGLQGKTDVYSSLWISLLEKCARTSRSDLKFRITSPFPLYENEPINFDIISSGKEPQLTIDNIGFPLTEDVFIDDLWHGTTWLDGNRWHDFTLDSATTAVHVMKTGAWKSIYASNNRKATAMHAGQQSGDELASTQRDDKAIKIALFSIFILSAGFLWVAPKL